MIFWPSSTLHVVRGQAPGRSRQPFDDSAVFAEDDSFGVDSLEDDSPEDDPVLEDPVSLPLPVDGLEDFRA